MTEQIADVNERRQQQNTPEESRIVKIKSKAPTRTIGEDGKERDTTPLEQLRWYLEDAESGYRTRLQQMMGSKRAPQFFSSVMNLANTSAKFKEVEPRSIIAAAVIAATLDLPIDRNMGFAWIIPYGKLAQFQIGYKGWIQLALRSGKYAGMNAVIVNEDAWQGWDMIGDPVIRWDLIDKTKPAIGYCFAWRLTTGFTKMVYWSKEQVEAHASRYSQAYKQKKKDSPWFTHFDEMGLKTVISNALRRWGIMSVEYQELQIAYERDQSAAIDIDATPIYPDNDEYTDATETEPIREPQPKQLAEAKEAAGLTVEAVKKGKTKGKTKEKVERVKKTDDAPEQQTEVRTARARDDEPVADAAASPGSIMTIKKKMERGTLSLAELKKARPEFSNMQSIDELKASQVNTVLKWIDDPTRPAA